MRSTMIVASVAALADLLLLAQDVGAHHLAQAGGQDVVGHVADDDGGEEAVAAQVLDGLQQDAPAPCPQPHADEVHDERGQDVEVVGGATAPARPRSSCTPRKASARKKRLMSRPSQNFQLRSMCYVLSRRVSMAS